MARAPSPNYKLAVMHGLVALAAAGVAGALCPNLSAATWSSEFRDFFVALAGVNGSLLITIAVGARYGRRLSSLAPVTAVSLACGVVGSIVALSPLPKAAFGWVLAISVGGGAGGLVAAVVVGWSNLQRDIGADRAAEESRQIIQALAEAGVVFHIVQPPGGTGEPVPPVETKSTATT